ncbi:MAG: L-threonylcarbamoyladenylate synthase [Acidobacteriota bacterium]
MRTVITDSPEAAAVYIRSGGVVAFPTETVYGLGANVFNAAAVARIFEAKRRPADNPLIVHIGSLKQLDLLTSEVKGSARRLMDHFFPGPLTVVVRRSPEVSDIVTAGLHSIGVRMPASDIARRFIESCGVPIAAPSANLSGRPSPTTWQAVLEDLDGRIDCILQGEPTKIGLESTIVDCTKAQPRLLRTGAISIDGLRHVVPNIIEPEPDELIEIRSPGLRHRHYSPNAKVVIASGEDNTGGQEETAYIGITVPIAVYKLTAVCRSMDEYAGRIFEFFRECDRQGIETIYCEAVPAEGIGAALMDRIRRATEN